MRKEYREVVFQDIQTGKKFLTRSTADAFETIKMEDGKVYPLVKVETTSDSHPAYTGRVSREVTTARIEAFNRRYARTAKVSKA